MNAPKPTLDERRDKWINKHYDWQGTSSDDNFKRLLREGWDACAKEKDAEIELIHSRYKTGRALLQIEMLEAENQKLREALELAVKYLEPRLANKYGSHGLTVVLPTLKKALEEK